VPDFAASRALIQSYVDRQLLAGASAVVMQGGQQLDAFCIGFSSVETSELLQPNRIYRAFSNTKLITSSLTLMFMDEGHFALDDPVKNWIPEFGNLRVLRPGAQSVDDTVALQTDITIRHLLSHTSGLSHGVFDPSTVIFNAYTAAGVRSAQLTLAQVMPKLAALPLSFQPGQGWDYAMGADLLARLMEIITGKTYAEILQTRIFDPLGMADTGYLVSPANRARLLPLYRGEDPLQPMSPGLHLTDNLPWPDAFVNPVPRQAGTGGLVTTQADYLRFMQALFGDGSGSKLLKPDTLKEMLQDQVAPQYSVQFQHLGAMPHLGFGLGGAITRTASALQPNSPPGEFQWGGLAGTHWSYCPNNGVMIVQMAQRHFAFWHPFWFEYKAAVYQALL
jgi:CubicO group peptidase (beta-lactamase class C family)